MGYKIILGFERLTASRTLELREYVTPVEVLP